MSPTSSGKQNGFHDPSRKLRFDDLGTDAGNRRSDGLMTAEVGRGRSGRRFVVVAVVVILLTWGGLYLAFQRWREPSVSEPPGVHRMSLRRSTRSRKLSRPALTGQSLKAGPMRPTPCS